MSSGTAEGNKFRAVGDGRKSTRVLVAAWTAVGHASKCALVWASKGGSVRFAGAPPKRSSFSFSTRVIAQENHRLPGRHPEVL